MHALHKMGLNSCGTILLQFSFRNHQQIINAQVCYFQSIVQNNNLVPLTVASPPVAWPILSNPLVGKSLQPNYPGRNRIGLWFLHTTMASVKVGCEEKPEWQGWSDGRQVAMT